jgi:lipopolysaccharide biosynthesis glycosyltransferase
MQLFNSEHHQGNLLYFDLDVVMVRDLTWITELSTEYFWTIRDFRYLQNTRTSTINSSAMWFNVEKFSWIWDEFQKSNVLENIRRFPGDQDFLNHVLNINQRRFFEDRRFESYRWQCQNGGYNFQRRAHRRPGAPASYGIDASVIVFHGTPKPHQVSDAIIRDFWK